MPEMRPKEAERAAKCQRRGTKVEPRAGDATSSALFNTAKNALPRPLFPHLASGRTYDAAVVGGGMAGLTATARLTEIGVRTLLVDCGLPQAGGRFGGFAKFSGAKFSLPPAGLGLIPVAGSRDRLLATIVKVLVFLGIEHEQSHPSEELWQGEERALDGGTLLRSYRSIVLTPARIDALIDRVTAQINPSGHLLRTVQRTHTSGQPLALGA